MIISQIKLKAYRGRNGQRLTSVLRKKMVNRNKLKRHADDEYRHVLFTDEKIFNIEQNRQNQWIYATEAPEKNPKIERRHHSAACLLENDENKCQKLPNGRLKKVVKSLHNTFRHWICQQNSALANNAKKNNAAV